MTTPAHRKPPLAAWIQRERKRKGWKPKDVVDRLAAMNLEVSEATVKVWESNADRRPSPYNIEGLEAIFGSPAPHTERAGASSDPALSELLKPLVSALSDLVVELREARQERADLLERVEALETAAKLQDRSDAGAVDDPTTPVQREG